MFFVFVDILNHIKQLNPNVLFLQENVGSASKLDVGIMSRELGVYPVRFNSSKVTAQMRDRYYWTNIKTKETMFDKVVDIPEPKDKKIMLKDILENGYSEKNKSMCLLESNSRPLSTPSKMARRYFEIGMANLIFKDEQTFLRVKEATKIGFIDIANNEAVDLSYPTSTTRRGRSMKDKSNCLLRNNEYFVFQDGDIRYFTQTELERLQGFEDGHTSILTRNQAACLLGDGWTLPVIEHIFSFINK